VDLAIVYLGHNEFLEQVYFDPNSVSARAEFIGRMARQSRVVNWLRGIAEGFGVSFQPRLQRHFISNQQYPLIHSDEEYQSRLQFLEANIRQMIQFAKTHKIQIVFMPAIPSLLTPPGDSIHGPEYSKHVDEWQRIDAQIHRDSGDTPTNLAGAADLPQRISALETLCELDETYAESHYLLGLTYLQSGDTAQALVELRKENCYDRRGDRSNDDIMERIQHVCSEQGVPCIDARDLFYSHLESEFARMAKQEKLALFLDHCHPTEEGHRIIADAFVGELIEGANRR
jgi:lysophospholipase L1-like esterase